MKRFTILVLLTTALGSGAAVAEGKGNDLVAPAGAASQFAGVPPQGTHASTPTTGRLLFSFSVHPLGVEHNPYLTWNLYEDGRVIWQKWSSPGDPIVIPHGARLIDTGYVQQRLTPRGLQLLRTRILSSGLFAHNLRLRIARHHPAIWIEGRARRGAEMVTFGGWPPRVVTGYEPLAKATPAQERAVARIRTLLAHTAAWSLPTTAWADREVRAFVPSHYFLAFDRGAPDLTKLPSPLLRYKKLLSHASHRCQIVSTGELRAILRAVREARITPVSNHANWIAFGLKGRRGSPSSPHFSPVLPSDSPC